jgi:PilZ domain
MFGRRQTTAPPIHDERRDSPRYDTNLPARINMPGGKSVRCCIVNISASGALLMAPGVAGLPDQFALQDNSGRARRVQVVRKETSRVAVRFLAAA